MASTTAPMAVCDSSDYFCGKVLFACFRGSVMEEDRLGAYKAFAHMVTCASSDMERIGVLDAPTYAAWCETFSAEFTSCCHWVSPLSLRNHLTQRVAAVWCNVNEVADSAESVPQYKIEKVTHFFGTRLLLKRFRQGVRDSLEGPLPAALPRCEARFEELASYAVATTEGGLPLDAVQWADWFCCFSTEFMEVCHWVSPKKMREFLENNIGAEWIRCDEVPLEREAPPVDLKWYKNPEGVTKVQQCMCPLCNVMCNSIAQYDAHAEGRTHKSHARTFLKKNPGATVEPIPISPTETASPATPLMTPSLLALSPGDSSRWVQQTPGSYIDAVSHPTTPCDNPTPFLAAFDTPMNVAQMPLEILKALQSPKEETHHSQTSSDLPESETLSLLDAVSPAWSVQRETTAYPKNVIALINELSFEIASLTHDRVECAELVALQLMRATGGCEAVVAVILEMCLTAADPLPLAALTADLVCHDNELAVLLHEGVEGMVKAGFAVHDTEDDCFAAIFEAPEKRSFLGAASVRTRSKVRSLVRFVSELVQSRTLDGQDLHSCVTEVCATNATAQDMVCAVRAVAAAAPYMPSFARRASIAAIDATVSGSWYPERVRLNMLEMLCC